MIRYLILVLALLLVAIRLAPAQQGNLPKPVQSLPAGSMCNGRLDGRILRVAALSLRATISKNCWSVMLVHSRRG
jgi:hypothetical protein